MKNNPSVWEGVKESGIGDIFYPQRVGGLHCRPVEGRIDRPSIDTGFLFSINALRQIFCARCFVRSTSFSQNIAPRLARPILPRVLLRCFRRFANAQIRELLACSKLLLHPFWLTASPCPRFRRTVRISEFRGDFALASIRRIFTGAAAFVCADPVLRQLASVRARTRHPLPSP